MQVVSPYGQNSTLLNPVVTQSQKYPTDGICDRLLFQRMMQDYLELLYPLLPVVHRPTFIKDLKNDRDMYDKVFLALVVALSAALVGTIPRKFHEYQGWTKPLRFTTRKQMVDFCYELIYSLRGADYFDEPTHEKWAATYLLKVATYQLGRSNRAPMLLAEASQISRLMRYDDPTSYEGLSCIEVQLRKKAFWMTLYPFV